MRRFRHLVRRTSEGLPVVGFAALDGVGAVELFEQDDEGEFVLQGEGREGPDGVGFLSKFGDHRKHR